MLAAFWAVLNDLWLFVIGKEAAAPAALPAPTPRAVISRPDSLSVDRPAMMPKVDTLRFPEGSLAYVTGDEVSFYKRPVIAYDNKLGDVHYGETVSVDRIDGPYAYVRTRNGEGWMRAEALTEDRSAIFPKLEPGRIYSAHHEDTKKIRRILKDELMAGQLELPLQPAEFILYQLAEKQQRIDWPAERPRRAGSWHRILRGNRTVRIDIEPKTHSIMEYAAEDGRGVLGFVTAVTPEHTITLLSVGRFVDGECRQDELTEAQWRELRPVFITVR